MSDPTPTPQQMAVARAVIMEWMARASAGQKVDLNALIASALAAERQAALEEAILLMCTDCAANTPDPSPYYPPAQFEEHMDCWMHRWADSQFGARRCQASDIRALLAKDAG